jgi:plasmid stabilization system protein ParE
VSRPRLLPEASQEVREAAVRYESRSPGLGARFLDELEGILPQVGQSPESYPRHPFTQKRLGIRRALLRRFPYEIVFRFDGKAVTVLAVAHTARRPAYWRGRAEGP